MKLAKLWRGLATLTAVLLVVAIGAAPIADSRANTLNNWLGTSNYKTVVHEGESNSDGTYFDSEFSNLGEVVDAANALAVEISSEGSVLLKNNGTLPLDTASEKVTIWGLNSKSPILGGFIGSPVEPNMDAGQMSYGLEQALQERGFSLNTDMMDFYSSSSLDDYRLSVNFFGNLLSGHGLTPNFTSTFEEPATYTAGEAPASAYTQDVLASADGTTAVVLLSRDNCEACDYNLGMKAGNPGDHFDRPLALSEYERQMISLAKEHSEKVVVLINASNPMEIKELKDDDGIGAILWVGTPGMNGFLGVADILSGAVNPSGHLSDTYVANVTSNPAMLNFGIMTYTNYSQVSSELVEANKGDWYQVQTEGIYTGYKYYETRYEDMILSRANAGSDAGSTTGSGWNYADEMVYPFGYGLSYTTFEQKLNSVKVDVGGTGTAKVTVTNTGDTAGKSVVQLYVQAPYTTGGLEKVAIQLLDFGKTKVLQPGESEEITLEFEPKYMASYDETVIKADGTMGAWVLDPGDYYFSIGNGAHAALNNILAAKLGTAAGLTPITPEETVSADNAVLWTLGSRDVETYSVNVKNALQDCDINKLIEGAAEYTTRSDWTKGWKTVENITPTSEMMVNLTNNRHSLSTNGEGVSWGVNNGLKLIDFIQVDSEGNYAGVVPLDDPTWDLLVEQVSLDDAMVFMENNGEGMQSIQSIGYPANANNDGPVGFVFGQVPGYYIKWGTSSDEPTYVAENDEYAAYSMGVFPSEPIVAATFNKELVEREGEMMGEQSLWSNVPSIMAPGLCSHRSPYCARNHEYYSEDAMLTNRMGLAVCTGMAAKGLMAEVKHFAFNDQEMNRVGVSTYFTEQAGRETELRGFQAALESNQAMSIMTSFNRIGSTWAGGHEGLLTDITRNEWGFTGWITTDLINGADYQNWKDAISAGSSATLSNLTTYAETEWGTMVSNKAAIQKDTDFQQKMQQSLKYFFYTTVRSNAVNGITSNTELVYVRTPWQNAILGVEIGLGVLTAAFIGLTAWTMVKGKKQKEGQQ